jgi:hypothetical protein
MNDRTGRNRGPRRAAALAIAAAVAMLATACGGRIDVAAAGPDPAGSPTFAQELALAQCIRGHGVPGFPDPAAAGGFHVSAATIDSSQVQAAYGACRHLLAGGGPSITQLQREAQQQQQEPQKALPALLKFSQCMRSHGVPGFPDPPGSGTPAPPQGRGSNPDSPQFRAAVAACQRLLPAGAHLSVGTQSSKATS